MLKIKLGNKKSVQTLLERLTSRSFEWVNIVQISFFLSFLFSFFLLSLLPYFFLFCLFFFSFFPSFFPPFFPSTFLFFSHSPIFLHFCLSLSFLTVFLNSFLCLSFTLLWLFLFSFFLPTLSYFILPSFLFSFFLSIVVSSFHSFFLALFLHLSFISLFHLFKSRIESLTPPPFPTIPEQNATSLTYLTRERGGITSLSATEVGVV